MNDRWEARVSMSRPRHIARGRKRPLVFVRLSEYQDVGVLTRQVGMVVRIQSRPLVRSAFCPMKIDHTSGLTLHPSLSYPPPASRKTMSSTWFLSEPPLFIKFWLGVVNYRSCSTESIKNACSRFLARFWGEIYLRFWPYKRAFDLTSGFFY